MKKNIMIKEILQSILSEEKVEKTVKKYQKLKKTRKLSYGDLIKYLIIIALEKCKSYREAILLSIKYRLPRIHYSELSKRASELSFEIMKELFEYVVSLLNRKIRKRTNKINAIRKNILAIDSTTITKSKSQLKWAGFKGQVSGIKLHVQFDVEAYTPEKVEESLAKNHDSKFADKLKDEKSILVEDRAYGKIDRFEEYVSEEGRQSFVIRIKENLKLFRSKKLKGIREEKSKIISDVTCQLGSKQNRSKSRFRVVTFNDDNGNKIIVCTDLMNVTAEAIAEIYKVRWTIETFFRFIKQNLNLSVIFGTTKNAVFNQLYAALIAFVIIRFLFVKSSESCCYFKLTMIEFIRCLRVNEFQTELFIFLLNFLSAFKT